MEQSLMEFKGIVQTYFQGQNQCREIQDKEWLTQVFSFASLSNCPHAENLAKIKTKGYAGETDEQATENFWKHTNGINTVNSTC